LAPWHNPHRVTESRKPANSASPQTANG